jgi:DNA-binding GntR family transcriptional regulator
MAVKRQSPGKKDGQLGLAQAIYQGLCQEIVSGKLRPGEPLSRRRIARRYGASYTPVIEAMVRLEEAGLVEAESAQMARVARVTLETIRGVYVLLEAYETQSIRLACETATPAEIDELYSLAGAVETRIARRDSRDAEGPLVHWQFHRRIAQLSRVPALIRELDRSELLARYQTTWLVTARAAEDPPRWHSRLVDAVRSRDPEAADAAMRAHVRRGLEKELLAYQMKLSE